MAPGPWVWYGDYSLGGVGPGETDGTPYLARLASIYDVAAPGDDDPDLPPNQDSSYPEWAVEIDSAHTDFLEKEVLSSLCAYGQTGTEIVFLFIADGEEFAWVAMNAAGTPEFLWLADESESWDPGDEMGLLGILATSLVYDVLHFTTSVPWTWLMSTHSMRLGSVGKRRRACMRASRSSMSSAARRFSSKACRAFSMARSSNFFLVPRSGASTTPCCAPKCRIKTRSATCMSLSNEPTRSISCCRT